jgi:hypothetical protein
VLAIHLEPLRLPIAWHAGGPSSQFEAEPLEQHLMMNSMFSHPWLMERERSVSSMRRMKVPPW